MSTLATAAATLPPYAGTFGRAEAWHLMRRATFGATADRVDAAVADGLAATLERLAQPEAPFPQPINYDFPDDPFVPIGATWAEAPYPRGVDVSTYRIASYYRWVFDHFLSAGTSVERRLMLFLLNHFGVATEGDTRIVYQWYVLLREGTGMPFDELIKAVTVHPMMLRFLDGRTSVASSPNENYARELLELFTVGKGPQVGPGDYTTYTETDIRELARALTGWTTRYEYWDNPDYPPESHFVASRHDDGAKQLSARLGGARIEGAGAGEYVAVVDAIFAQPHVGDYVCRKLYRWFCYHDIDAATERDVIQPMAAAFRDSGWQLMAPVTLLLGSAHFYEARFRGALVKSPLDEICDLVHGLGHERPTGLDHEFWYLGMLNYICGREGMSLVTPPSVAGFKAFHQAPSYNRFWINAATLESRRGHAGWTIWSGYSNPAGERFPLDHLGLIATLANPSDPNDLVAEMAERLFPVPLSPAQLTALKSRLIPGLPDFEWTVEYGDHLDDPDDEMKRDAVVGRLKQLFYLMTSAADFHLY